MGLIYGFLSQSVLQAQKLIRLEEMACPEGQAEEEPEGKEIMGPSREALKSPSIGIPFSLSQFICRKNILSTRSVSQIPIIHGNWSF